MRNSCEICRLLEEELDGFSKLEKDWDSYGGYPPTEEALKTAIELLGGLFVCPLSSGGIGISLGDENIMIEVSPDGTWVVERLDSF